ncbi:MAG: hypothetical protein PHE83_13425 [Opitutaceae bacterium]|nr:hypothetical protein [Opitutaceae bacterium]
MSALSTRAAAVRDLLPPMILRSGDAEQELTRLLHAFHELAQYADNLFASPTDAFTVGDRIYHLPRFVLFGPNQGSGPIRLALYAGWSGTDTQGPLALFSLIERLVLHPAAASGYQLVFYPLVNPTGLQDQTAATRGGVRLEDENRATSEAPEISVLAKEFRLHQFHGWISLHAASAPDRIQARIRGLPVSADFFPIERGRFRIDWQADAATTNEGPAALNGDLPFGSFQLRLDVPDVWPDGLYTQAVVQTVRAFLDRYRRAAAYGINL